VICEDLCREDIINHHAKEIKPSVNPSELKLGTLCLRLNLIRQHLGFGLEVKTENEPSA
jgi:hypothetical protein